MTKQENFNLASFIKKADELHALNTELENGEHVDQLTDILSLVDPVLAVDPKNSAALGLQYHAQRKMEELKDKIQEGYTGLVVSLASAHLSWVVHASMEGSDVRHNPRYSDNGYFLDLSLEAREDSKPVQPKNLVRLLQALNCFAERGYALTKDYAPLEEALNTQNQEISLLELDAKHELFISANDRSACVYVSRPESISETRFNLDEYSQAMQSLGGLFSRLSSRVRNLSLEVKVEDKKYGSK